MKTRLQLFLSLALVSSPLGLLAEKPEPPVPITVNNYATPGLNGPETQKLYGPSSATIVPAEQARAIVEKFRAGYAKLGNPRVLFYINRELVDTTSGIKLSGRTEKYDNTKTSSGEQAPQSQTTHTTGENTYVLKDGTKATLADRQTTREVERLFGRAFRAGGATLADQKVAADLIGDKPVEDLTGTNDQAAKDREALAKVADVVIEILVSSRTVTVPKVSGDEQATIPDIQATAIRLKDAAIIGQAASTDVLGKDQAAGQTMMQFDVRDVTEATALALMEDLAAEAK